MQLDVAFRRFYWGFFFIMIDFRIQGIDIFPDIIGYILFALAFNILLNENDFFQKGSNFNIVMCILSIFAIYERPNQGMQNSGINININPLGFLIGIASLAFGLLVAYNLFMGIKDMGRSSGYYEIADEADIKWKQYLMLEIASLFAFIIIFIPMLNVMYIIALLIAAIILTVLIMKFMKKCGERFAGNGI